MKPARRAACLGVCCCFAVLFACLVRAAGETPPPTVASPDVDPPVYAYDTDPRPLSARREELARRPLPADLLPLPRVECPLYVMEFHIWWRSPYGTEGRGGYGHWDTDDDTDTDTRPGGPYWMRRSRHVGYPVTGLYNSEDEGILRWQLRCLHNTGVDGVFIQMYPEWVNGDTFVGSSIFARILKIADEEGVKIGIHDEIAFRQGRPAQDPAVMTKRTADFLKRFADDPAILRIDGKPVYAFQYWSRWDGRITDDQLVAMMKNVEAAYGKPVYWMPFHGPDPSLYARPEIPSLVANGDSNMIARNVTTFYPTDRDFSPAKMDERLAGYAQAMKDFPNKNLGMWVYPGFNDSPRPKSGFNWIPRQGGKTLVERLRQYMARRPNFIMLSSWNDWEENTALEPGLSYDGFDGDPYLYCRILAGVKGKTFTPPPLPPKGSVDPWLWHKLYGIDGEPPHISLMPAAAGKAVVTVSDPDSGVRSVWRRDAGDAFLDFAANGAPRAAGFAAPAAGLPLSAGQGLALAAEKTANLPLAPAAARAGSGPVYLALTFSATGPGRIEARYSGEHPLVQWKGNDYDEPKFPLHATFTADGAGTKTAARVLLEFRRDDPAPFVSLTWHPAKGADGAPSSACTVRRVDLFTTPRAGAAVPVAAADPKDPRRVQGVIAVTAESPVFVTAEDEAGNVAPPAPVYSGE